MIREPDAPPELVITTPAAYGSELAVRTGCRLTLGVLVQLIASAKYEVILSAPYAQAGVMATGPLAQALESALERGVRVDWMSTPASLPALSLRERGPGVLRLYRPEDGLLAGPNALGSHAKFLVADEEHAYVGSANFTGRGMGDQLEMGLLVHGETAREISRFWRYAVNIGLFVEVRD